MPLNWEQVIVDAVDPVAQGRWWATALGWAQVDSQPETGETQEVEIQPAAGVTPGLLFVRVPEAKTTKNRLHLDFRPQDRDAEVERLLALGAVPVDVGQQDVSWVVLADPEGNEFCILGAHATPA